MGADAALTEAKLNLSYTKIHSPIQGRISRNFVDTGNLVGSGGDKTLSGKYCELQSDFCLF